MNKKDEQEKRRPEDVAKDLEDIVFPEVDEEDLRDVFGGGDSDVRAECGNSNCGC